MNTKNDSYSKLGKLFPLIRFEMGSFAISDVDLVSLFTSMFKLRLDSISIAHELPLEREFIPICCKFLSDFDKTLDSTKAFNLFIFILLRFSLSVEEIKKVVIKISL